MCRDRLFLRAFIGLIAISAIMAPRHGWRGLITRRPKLQLIRNICHVGAQYGVFYAIITVPLAVVTSIEYLVPAITSVFAALTIGEKISRHRWIGMAVSFAGVLIIVRPGVADVSSAMLMVIVSAVLFSVQIVIVKVLSQIDGPGTMVFTQNAIQSFILIGPAVYVWVMPDWHHVPWIVVIGLSGMAAHYCLSHA